MLWWVTSWVHTWMTKRQKERRHGSAKGGKEVRDRLALVYVAA